ncbi:MAG: hypothetical protein ABSF38_11080, partial [Verrucomicrobiota bacterium]
MVAAITVEVLAAVPARTAEQVVAASPTGALWTALVERSKASALAPTVTPRLTKNSRSLSTARLVRFCAASSLMPRIRAISKA